MTDLLSDLAEARAKMNAMLTKKAWEDEAFRQRLVADPKAAIAELLGQPLADSLTVSVHEEGPGSLHFVIPGKPSPQGPEELSDADLEMTAAGTGPRSSPIILTIYPSCQPAAAMKK